eukprot:4257909-Pleurochrysis_carterae.AAC.2
MAVSQTVLTTPTAAATAAASCACAASPRSGCAAHRPSRPHARTKSRILRPQRRRPRPIPPCKHCCREQMVTYAEKEAQSSQ